MAADQHEVEDHGRLALPGPATVGLERAARDHVVGLDALAIAAALT